MRADGPLNLGFVFPILLVWLLIALPVPVAAAGDWAMPAAAFRVRIDKAGGQPGQGNVGWTMVAPCGLDPLRCQVAVYAANGVRVGAHVFWAARDEPVKIMFEAPGLGGPYYVYLGNGLPAGPAWRPAGGVLLETRAFRQARFEQWEAAWRFYEGASPILGRSMVNAIFHGIHPHGPTANFMAYYRGHFVAGPAGRYEFAVVTREPAFLRIDGQVVARHRTGVGGWGQFGEFGGGLNLKAGPHVIEYLAVHHTGQWSAEAAWKPPGKKYFELMPPDCFVGAAQYEPTDYEAAPTYGNKLYFSWRSLEHCLAEGTAVVTAQLAALPNTGGWDYRWTFEDGGTAQGAVVSHVFPRPGLQRVTLEAFNRNQRLGLLNQTVNIQPQWLQGEEWPEGTYQRQREALMARTYERAPAVDLAAVVRLAHRNQDPELLGRIGPWCARRLGEQPPALGEAFYWLGFYYESANVRNYSMAERCWQAASRAGMGGFADKARLQLARYQVEVAGKADEALATLAQVAEASLDDPEKRLRKLVTGDALLLQGKAAEARNSYRAAGTLVNPRDRDQESRGRVRLESAKDYIRRGEYELAEDALRQIEWETPLARLSVEAGLTRIKLSLARKEHPRALNRCLQLLEVTIVDTDHADLLYQLAQIYLALGREEPAQSALNRLLKEHPYSEAAALAKDKWGGRVPKPASKPGAKPPR